MKKTLLMVLLYLFTYSSLLSIQIERITYISNGEQILEYNAYLGHITGYEDRVFVQNASSLEEFVVSENGNLQRISYFETFHGSNAKLYVHNDKLYVVNFVYPPTNNNLFFRVFDLTTQPMTEIPDIDLTIQCSSMPNVFFYDNFILVADAVRTYRIDAETMELLDLIPRFVDYYYMRNSGSLFVKLNYVNSTVVFSELIDFQLEYVSTANLSVSIEQLAQFEFSYPYFVITRYDGVTVIDVTDSANPIVLYEIVTTDFMEDVVFNAIYTGDYIICSDGGMNLFVFSADPDGEYSLFSMRTVETLGAWFPKLNLYCKDNFVFQQNNKNISVFDFHSAGLDLLDSYGYYDFTYPFHAFDMHRMVPVSIK
jgi:hypothetical protein